MTTGKEGKDGCFLIVDRSLAIKHMLRTTIKITTLPILPVLIGAPFPLYKLQHQCNSNRPLPINQSITMNLQSTTKPNPHITIYLIRLPHQMRSQWKGPFVSDSTIVPEMMGIRFVHCGKKYQELTLCDLHLGHKFGEFAFPCTTPVSIFEHAMPKKGKKKNTWFVGHRGSST